MGGLALFVALAATTGKKSISTESTASTSEEAALRAKLMRLCEEVDPINARNKLLPQLQSFYVAAGLPVSYRVGSSGMPYPVFSYPLIDVETWDKITDGLEAKRSGLSRQWNSEVLPELNKLPEMEVNWADTNRQLCEEKAYEPATPGIL